MYLDENGNPLSLDETEELSEFLQGKKPEGYHLNTMPHLTEEQAWTVIYVLQEKFRLIPDHYEKCDKCGEFFNFHDEGYWLESSSRKYPRDEEMWGDIKDIPKFCGCYCDWCLEPAIREHRYELEQKVKRIGSQIRWLMGVTP